MIRALLYPIYKGMYERRTAAFRGFASIKDLRVQMARDFFRSLDYLESLPDIDPAKLAYFGANFRASMGTTSPLPCS